MTSSTTISKLIKDWLSDQSQGKRDFTFMAKKTGLSRTLLSKILSDDRIVTSKTCIKLAPVLGKPITELLNIIGTIPDQEIKDLQVAQPKENYDIPPIPTEIHEALQDPEYREFILKFWRLKKENPGMDILSLLKKLSALSPSQKILALKLIEAI